MKKRTVIVDNFFDSPRDVREYGLSLPFFTNNKENSWEGVRTKNLDDINPEFHGNLVKAMVDSFFGYHVKAVVDAHSYFHSNSESDMMTENYIDKLKRIHVDEEPYIGIVYLSKFPISGSGLYIYNGDEPDYIKNNFNRFIMFPSGSVEHEIGKLFGKDKYDSRLTLICFFRSIDIQE